MQNFIKMILSRQILLTNIEDIDMTILNDLSQFQHKGYIILPKFLNNNELDVFISCTNDLTDQEEKPGAPMKYFESSVKTKNELLNRVENFVDEYPLLKNIILGEKFRHILKQLTGKNHLLFKDKINFKLSGGGGFSVHQDAPAFTLFTPNELLVVMVPVDKVSQENGCMQVANNFFDNTFIPHVQGKISDEKLTDIQWKDIELNPGDVFIFSSFLIHRSADNLSPHSRRCFYLTYNCADEGDLRKDYFEYKRREFPPRIERTLEKNFEQWKLKLSKPIL
jgi:hypothetical protein